jgi:selenocysteine lyase/cysteine desulfurase
VRRAVDAHLDRWQDDPDWGAWGEAVEAARRQFARLVHARPEDIAVAANASQGIGAVMSALHPRPGRSAIVTWENDFPTSQALAERQRARGFEHRRVTGEGLAMRADAWARHLGNDAALAVVPAVASFSGYRLDLRAFVGAAHARGTPILVDAFQAAGTFDIDVKALDVDFLVSGVYKWLLAPAGLAFLYVRPDHAAALEPATSGWLSLEQPYAFEPLGPLASDARRFQSGGPSVIGCAAAAESLALVQEVGLGNVERHNRGLVERVMAHARERKWEILTPEAPQERASIVTFRGMDAQHALETLARERVVVNPRLGGLRVSPHFYNTEADVDRLFHVLDA